MGRCDRERKQVEELFGQYVDLHMDLVDMQGEVIHSMLPIYS